MTDKMLACFAAAERTGSFSTAAWELSMTQQAVSYSIRRLEEELGFPLFIRRASRVELTAGGSEFFAWYMALDREAERLASEGLETVPSGTISDTQLRCFLAVARTGDLAAAAESLYYTPQTLSEHLAALEKALGVKLLRRETGAIALTARGRAYRQVLENAAGSLASVRAYAKARYEAGLGSAVLGLSEWLTEKGPLREALDAFDGDVRVETMPNYELMAALEAGSVDLALWSEGHAPVNRGFETTALGPEDICLFVPADGRPAPLLVCPGWPRSYLENRAIVTQETAFGDYAPKGIRQVEDLGRMIALLRTGEYAAVGDRRFGSLAAETAAPAALRAIPLGVGSDLVACRRTNVGDDCAARLVRHLRAAFGGDTK